MINNNKEIFDKLYKAYKDETGYLSDLRKAFSNPNYLNIVGMGNDALPFIMEKVYEDNFWGIHHFNYALRMITGVDSPERKNGDVSITFLYRCKEFWVNWYEKYLIEKSIDTAFKQQSKNFIRNMEESLKDCLANFVKISEGRVSEYTPQKIAKKDLNEWQCDLIALLIDRYNGGKIPVNYENFNRKGIIFGYSDYTFRIFKKTSELQIIQDGATIERFSNPNVSCSGGLYETLSENVKSLTIEEIVTSIKREP
jgi:hypothetical protein